MYTSKIFEIKYQYYRNTGFVLKSLILKYFLLIGCKIFLENTGVFLPKKSHLILAQYFIPIKQFYPRICKWIYSILFIQYCSGTRVMISDESNIACEVYLQNNKEIVVECSIKCENKDMPMFSR